MKIVTVVGARPQFIKAATISRSLAKKGIKEKIIHTGQHFDKNMSDIFFEEMNIPKPDYFLDINGLEHGAMTGRMLEGIESILLKEKPDYLIVYGDTNSTLAGAIAAKKLHIKIIHIEAGLRSFNMQMPEEVNRILTDRISSKLFCPTYTAIKNLKDEGYDNFDCEIVLSGDVMYDAALFYSNISHERSTISKELDLQHNYVLATIHRQENTDLSENLKNIVTALNEINNECPVIVPVHPRTRKRIENLKLDIRFTMIKPVGYFDMLELIKNCDLIMTDSGGLQKEAFFFHKKCITMREQTEWIELVKNGFNMLTGADTLKITNAFQTMMKKQVNFSINLYGEGNAADNIVNNLIK